ncbi:MAG: sulfurtransferase TusA family protein [Nitrospirae bacterium]|nr:sulfurtransferase TusA family protein [Nitrospirota bacterium]
MGSATAMKVVDCKGMSCPRPVLQTKKGLDTIASGQCLQVIATDAGAKKDIPALVSRLGHSITDVSENGGTITFTIEKK